MVKQADKKAAVKTAAKEETPLVFRKERKYAISEVDFDVVENYVRSHPAMFSNPYPPRLVNNIYFDLPSFQNYGDNVAGAKQRRKFRIRWYGEQFGYIEKPVMEIKIKEGLAGSKKYFPLAPFTLEPGFSAMDIQKFLDESEIEPEAREALHHFVPTLLNQYYRKYYLSADRRFRLTLDYNVSYTRISRHQNYFMRLVVDRENVIMEIKYDVVDDENVSWISSYFPFRMTKNSKYVNGVDSLDVW
jgi:hypothetical protein